MSETTEPQALTPPEGQPAPEQEAEHQQPQQEEQPRENAVEKRFSRLTARLSTISRERDELANRMALLEQRLQTAQPQQPPNPEQQAQIEQQARALADQQRTQERIDTFHAAGKEHYPDWSERCSDLIAMGADPQFAQLLVEIPDGYRIAAALRDDPEEVERIVAIRGERARMLELGKYAAKLEAKPTRNVSRAPAPPKPVEGRAATVFIPQQASMEQLLDHYSKQAMERRRNGQ